MHKLQSPDPKWIDFADAGLPGVRALFAPVTPLAQRDAQKAARMATRDLPADVTAQDRTEAAGFAYSAALIGACLRDWEEIGDADGAPLPFSAEAVPGFLADPELYDAAYLLFVTPYLLRDAEKNASPASPPGTGGRTAGKATAKGANRPGAAKSAPTKSTSRKPTKASRPGS